MMNNAMLATHTMPIWLLRIGVAFAFLYPPIAAFFEPLAWIGYFPIFILDLPFSDEVTLHLFGALEIIIGVWILIGKKILIPSIIATIMLLAIVLLNLSQMSVLFRDISIACMSLALVFIELTSTKPALAAND